MLRREFLQASAVAPAGWKTVVGSTLRALRNTQGSGERPNILWITCEDMSPRLGCYGDGTVPTPNIDRLAQQGVRYANAFATSPVCGPSRHALITGMYPTATYAFHMRNHNRTGALAEITDPAIRAFATNRPLYEAVPPTEVRCLTEYLRVAGYYCSNNQKEDYQFHAPATAWDESSGEAHWRNREPGQPFFSVFNFEVTHESGVFGEGRSPKVVAPNDVPVPAYYPDTPVVRADLAKHYDNIAALDIQIGALLEQLSEDALADNTYVFFFSDHGDGLPRAKRWVYESGTHVPLIVRHPQGKDAGTENNRLVSFVDFGPTILSLAGVAVPNHVHGTPFLGDSAGAPRQFVYLHRDRNGENRETIRAVRDERYRYVRNYRPNEPYIKPMAYRDRQAIMQELNRLIADDLLGPDQWQFSARFKPIEEFYDTWADPDEINNLAADPSHFQKMSEMRAALDAWTAVCNDPLDMPEDELVPQRVYPPDGRQPTTATPTATLEPGSGGRSRLTITCGTDGASIGYRVRQGNRVDEDWHPWTIYTGQVELEVTGALEVFAHRIGFKPSPNVEVPVPGN
ncbi:sulfatase [Gemmatimonadota bacterium]